MGIVRDPDVARRIARAVVSDIVLYNAKKAEEGIAKDNLFALLKNEERAGARLARYLSCALPGLSRTRIQQLIGLGLVSLRGAEARPSARLKGNEVITVLIPPPRPLDLVPEGRPIGVLFEDDHLMVVEKPAGVGGDPAPRPGGGPPGPVPLSPPRPPPEAGGEGGAPGPRPWCRHARPRSSVPPRQSLGDRRRREAGDRPPARQGHFRDHRGGEGRCLPHGAHRAVGRPQDGQALPRDRVGKAFGGRGNGEDAGREGSRSAAEACG